MTRLSTNIVPPVGPLGAAICFIGEAPGAEENTACQPFIGQAGQLLNRVLRKKQINRGEVLIHNLFNQQPPKNNLGYFYQDKGRKLLTWEGEDHISSLRSWLEMLLLRRSRGLGGPNVLVALGAAPLKHLTGKRRITKWRGSLLPCTLVPGFKVYPTFHPSFVNRLLNEPTIALQGEKKKDAQNVLPLFEVDIDRVLIQSEFPEINYPKRKFDISLSHSEIISHLKRLDEKNIPLVGVDIETLQGNAGPIVWCIGFAPNPEYAFVIPILKRQQFAWTQDEEAEIWYWVSKVFLNPKIGKIFQGGSYDLAILGRYYGLRCASGSYLDTMHCHHASYPYLRKSLELLASMYTWEPYYKDEGRVSLGKRTDEGEFNYNAKDCTVTREVYDATSRDAKELGTWDGYKRTVGIIPSHLAMTLRGVKIDEEGKARLGEEFLGKAAEFARLIQDEVGWADLNLDSSSQKQRLLYGYLGMEIQFNHKTKKATTDKDALNKLKKKYPASPLLEWLLQYQKFAKLASTYTTMKTDTDGRMRTSYGVVSTWRMNSSASPFGGWGKADKEGGNLQNIPKKGEEGRLVRKLFIADPGMVMVASDRRQAEAMVIAWDSMDMARIKLFLEGFDIHWFNARAIFSIPDSVVYLPKATFLNPVTSSTYTLKEYRDIGKTIEYAGSYGMGPYMAQAILSREGVSIEFKEAKAMLMSQKRANPIKENWKRQIRDEVRATRLLITPLGRRRYFMGRFGDSLYRAAYAFRPQSTVGELTALTIQRVHEKLDYFQLLLNAHDELVGQCKPEDVDKAIGDITELSSYPIEIRGKMLDIPVDFKVGENWGELEEVEIDD